MCYEYRDAEGKVVAEEDLNEGKGYNGKREGKRRKRAETSYEDGERRERRVSRACSRTGEKHVSEHDRLTGRFPFDPGSVDGDLLDTVSNLPDHVDQIPQAEKSGGRDHRRIPESRFVRKE